jgi:arylsulfatase
MRINSIFLALALAAVEIAQAPATQNNRPNIVFILMDNLGYGELGCYGGGILLTPDPYTPANHETSS